MRKNISEASKFVVRSTYTAFDPGHRAARRKKTGKMTSKIDSAGTQILLPAMLTHVFLGFDHEHHRIAIAALPDTDDKVRSSAGLEHVGVIYDSLDELALAYCQRRNLGITTSIYYQDPDSNNIETQVDNFENNNEARALMMTAYFKQNPVGVEFVPEALVHRLESGEDHASIKKRPDIE